MPKVANSDSDYGNIACCKCMYCMLDDMCSDPAARRTDTIPFSPMWGRNAITIARLVSIHDANRNKYGKCPGFKPIPPEKPTIDERILCALASVILWFTKAIISLKEKICQKKS